MAPIASKTEAPIRVVEETDENGDSDPQFQQSSTPLSPPGVPDEAQSGSPSPLLTDSVASVSPLSVEAAQPSTPKMGFIHPILVRTSEGDAPPLFSIEQLGVDRRLIVNRKRQLKMYRVWMQGKFKKL